MRHPRLDGLPHSAEVDIDRLFPAVLAHLVELDARGADASVGHDDVQPTQLFDAAVDRGRKGVEVAHVDLGGDDAAVEVLHHIGGLGEVLRCGSRCGRVLEPAADVDRDDVGAFFCQPHRVASALTPCGAGDERDLAVYPSGHCTPNPISTCWAIAQHLS